MTSLNPETLRRGLLPLTVAGFVMIGALSSCSGTDSAAQAQEPVATSATVALATVAPTTVAPTTVAPTTDAPTTVAVTEAPTTVVVAADPVPPLAVPETVPDETVPVETTPVETSTTLPPVTTSSLALNEVEVGPFPAPLAAVGKRSGADTQAIQMRLLQLGFWLSATDGEYGLTTRQAVMAFQKYIGLPATGEVNSDTAAYLTNFTLRANGRTDTGTLVEVDKTRQLLFFVVDGKTQWVFNTSTATGEPYEEEDKNTPGEIQKGVSITPNGLWKVNRERPEGWWPGDLGEIYRPKYFVGGVAVHGSNSIPNYPASHGCVRLSVPAMDFVWDTNLMPLGITVWVHG